MLLVLSLTAVSSFIARGPECAQDLAEGPHHSIGTGSVFLVLGFVRGFFRFFWGGGQGERGGVEGKERKGMAGVIGREQKDRLQQMVSISRNYFIFLTKRVMPVFMSNTAVKHCFKNASFLLTPALQNTTCQKTARYRISEKHCACPALLSNRPRNESSTGHAAKRSIVYLGGRVVGGGGCGHVLSAFLQQNNVRRFPLYHCT